MATFLTILISLCVGFGAGLFFHRYFLKPSVIINCQQISIKRTEKTIFEVRGNVDFVMNISESFQVEGNSTEPVLSCKGKNTSLPKIESGYFKKSHEN